MSYLCPSFISRSLETSKKRRERSFLRNGSLLLKELIASSDGKYNQFRSYSAEELKNATNNYDPSCNCGRHWYRGIIEGRVVSILLRDKRGNVVEKDYPFQYLCQHVATDISYSAMLSGHKNVLKLLGCCLETTIPTVVYEYSGNGTLFDRIYTSTETDFQPLPWKSRLEMAGQIAHTIAYLHTAFAKPIIHRRIEPSNILLDQNDVPKLHNFSESMTIRPGETVIVNSYAGGLGYRTADEGGLVNEKIDVSCFGALLLELLTGKRPQELHDLATGLTCSPWPTCDHIKGYISCHSIDDIVDSTFFLAEGGVSEQQQHQWESVKELALKCITAHMEERPTMVEVTKELWQINLR